MIIIRPIIGYENIYEAHSDGTIWSCEGKVTYRNLNGKKIKRVWKQRKLKVKVGKRQRSSNKDLRVELWKNGNHSTKLVSRLIAESFISNPIDLPCVNHIDGNSLNNVPDNLEWCTYKYNQNHAYNNGLNNEPISVSLINDRNEEFNFISLAKASLFLNHNENYLSNFIIKHPNKNKVGNYKIIKH
ncbi:HNH endonuclease [Apilactobacillus micheneri]|uniref:HNH endonuclease n=1 Tax=Apilactobacillus micheneri TaxID=1899430 RepID=UPI00112A8000|nr:HNH endonuclease [Apilactobacillus micheneri]TPR41249.1 HNH endonuclease [Apilactobacillus micheneri]